MDDLAGAGTGSSPMRGRLSLFDRLTPGVFITAELMVVAAALAGYAGAQSDTYWHLAAGRAMARTGHVMLTDEFSHTVAGAPWLNYEWLTQVVFYQLYEAGGMALLTAMCGVMVFGAYVLAWTLTRGSLEDRAVLMAAVLPFVTPAWTLRPHVFTLFLLMVVARLVVNQRFWFLPLIFLVWANLHAAVVLGIVVLVSDLAIAILERRGRLRRITNTLLCLAATLATPLGPKLWPEIWRSVNRSSANRITEWMPPGLNSKYAIFWLAAACFAWLAITRWRQLRGQRERLLVVAAGLMVLLAMRASRNITPFGLLGAPAMSVLLWRTETEPRSDAVVRSGRGAAARASILALSIITAASAVAWRWFASPPPGDWTPVSADAAATIRGCPGPIYNHYNVGGYLIWFVPEKKVFLDSRQDPYPVELLRAQREAADARALQELLARYRMRCAVLEPESPERGAFRSLGWIEAHLDTHLVVLRAP